MTPNPDALSGAWNFRDIAEETGARPGRFFRSSELSGLDDEGIAFVVDPGAQTEDKVILAAQGCPTQAISIVDD